MISVAYDLLYIYIFFPGGLQKRGYPRVRAEQVNEINDRIFWYFLGRAMEHGGTEVTFWNNSKNGTKMRIPQICRFEGLRIYRGQSISGEFEN